MQNLMRCKACGLILKESNVKDVCPACGVPKTAFEPFKDKVSDKRNRIIELHLHPIAVHFPQAFAVIIPFMLLCGIVISSYSKTLYNELLMTAKVLSILLPLTVLPAIMSGLIDGKTRFKKLTTPYLIKKMILASLLLIISIIISILVFIYGIESPIHYYIIILSIGSIICQIMLAQIGAKLMYSILPG